MLGKVGRQSVAMATSLLMHGAASLPVRAVTHSMGGRYFLQTSIDSLRSQTSSGFTLNFFACSLAGH